METTQNTNYITSSYQRRAYKSYLDRKKNDTVFKSKMVLHQKIFYQRKKQRNLNEELKNTDDDAIIKKLHKKLEKSINILKSLEQEKIEKFQSMSSSDSESNE